MKCPECKSDQIRQSKRRGWYELFVLKYKDMEPYRCVTCGERFFAATGGNVVNQYNQRHSTLSKVGLTKVRRKHLKRTFWMSLLVLLCIIVAFGIASNMSGDVKPPQ